MPCLSASARRLLLGAPYSRLARLGLMWTSTMLIGCAGSVQTVHVEPNQRVTTPTDTTLAQCHLTVFVEPFADVRPQPDAWVVGRARIGVYNRSVPIHSQAPVTTLCTNQVRSAWMSAGVQVVDSAGAADVIVRGRINQYWVGEVGVGGGGEQSSARVEFDVAVYGTQPEARLWYGVKEGVSQSGKVFWDTSRANGGMLNRAVTDALRNFLTDETLAPSLRDYAIARGKIATVKP